MTHRATNRFEQPKRVVPYRLYLACMLPIGLLWFWLEDGGADLSPMTIILGMYGLIHVSTGIARFILNEWYSRQ